MCSHMLAFHVRTICGDGPEYGTDKFIATPRANKISLKIDLTTSERGIWPGNIGANKKGLSHDAVELIPQKNQPKFSLFTHTKYAQSTSGLIVKYSRPDHQASSEAHFPQYDKSGLTAEYLRLQTLYLRGGANIVPGTQQFPIWCPQAVHAYPEMSISEAKSDQFGPSTRKMLQGLKTQLTDVNFWNVSLSFA